MQIHEFTGEEFDQVASEFFIAVNARTRPGFRGRVAFRDLGETVTLCQSHWRGPLWAVRTDRMAGKASVDNLMLFCVQMAGKSTNWQHDRFAELPAHSGLLVEARSPYKWISSTETRSVTLRFPRELLPLRSIEVTEACARTMDPAAPAMQMLSVYLGRLLEVAEDLSAPQRQDAGRARWICLRWRCGTPHPRCRAGRVPRACCST